MWLWHCIKMFYFLSFFVKSSFIFQLKNILYVYALAFLFSSSFLSGGLRRIVVLNFCYFSLPFLAFFKYSFIVSRSFDVVGFCVQIFMWVFHWAAASI